MSMSARAIPLTEWIHSFQTLFDQQLLYNNYTTNNVSPSADDFLPALRIALSLADQICKAEEETGQTPMPTSHWIDSILIHFQSKTLQLQSKDSEDGYDVENVFHALINDGTSLSSDERAVEEGGRVGSDIRVEILPSLFHTTNIDDVRGQMNAILYSLGIF